MCIIRVKVALWRRMADVGCVSGGCDSGARPAYVSPDGTYGRSLQPFRTMRMSHNGVTHPVTIY